MTTAQLQSTINKLKAENAALREKLDYAEAVAGIKEGLDQINRGLGRPARQVVKELRAKHKLPRTK